MPKEVYIVKRNKYICLALLFPKTTLVNEGNLEKILNRFSKFFEIGNIRTAGIKKFC